MSLTDPAAYAQGLVADVLATAEAEGASAAEVFTRRVLDDLEQAGEVENTFTAYHRAHGLEVNGYGVNESLGTLDMFVTHFSLDPFGDKLGRAQAEMMLKRLSTFVRRCREGLARDVDESSDLHDMCIAVEKTLSETSRIRLFLLTDAISTVTTLPPGDLDGLPFTHEIWDLTRLHRMASSGTLSEPISVQFDPPLPCLATPETGDYSVYMAIVRGEDLADLYDRYGTRLLELNVRSFLQTKGGVNRGIRDTLLHDPGRFLAYNNGITATASGVELVRLPDGALAIGCINDLQVVNGGQTTASIHYARKRDKADLSSVHIQMKLTVVESRDRLREIVPEISKYSNTQNKVTIVDFSSNHPFHVAVEKVTRSLWAPAADGSGQETRWFYERARGQYVDALARENGLASQRKFKALHPTGQKFSKSDLAKFVHAWESRPHLVSRGAEKNFREFMLRIGEDGPAVDVSYCRRLIAKAVLFKATDKIVDARRFGGYKINVTAYTVARLAQETGRRIDLDRIWREQGVTPALAAALDDLAAPVFQVIAQPLRGAHVGEWAKHPDCWGAVLEIPWSVPEALTAELMDQPADDQAVPADSAVHPDVLAVMSSPAPIWYAVSKWAKETQNLQPWQRQLAYTVGRYRSNDWTVSDKQAVQAARLLAEAQKLGFRAES